MIKLNYVLDSYSLIAFFQNEKGANTVADLITEAQNGDLILFLHSVNWGEIYYTAYREKGVTAAQKVADTIRKLPILVIEDASLNFISGVATIKGKYSLAYADAFAIWLGLSKNAFLVTGDPEIIKASKKENKLKVINIRE